MNEKMKIKDNIVINFNIILMFFCYFFNLYTVLNILLIIDILFLFKKKLKLSITSKLYFISIFIIVLISPFSYNASISFRFIYVLFCLGIIKILIENAVFESKKVLKFIYIVVFIHTFAVLLQYFYPSMINNFNHNFLRGNYYINYTLFLNNSYAGITGQTGVAAFYISIFIGISFINFFYMKDHNKYLYLILLLLGFCALFLTVKRSFILINVIIILLILLLTKKINLKTIIKILLILLLLFLIINKISILESLLNKIDILSQEDNISNGRNILWDGTFSLFKNNMFIGIGINNIELFLQEQTHNIYLQLLAEIGIVGMIPLIVFFVVSVVSNYKLMKHSFNITILICLYIQMLFILYGIVGNDFYSQLFLFPYLFFIAIYENQKIIKEEMNIDEKSSNFNI